MGFFSTLITESICPHCKNKIDIRIQFKYGEYYMHNYACGEKIIWGERNYGEYNQDFVVVDGIAEDCPLCGESDDYYIYVDNNRIKSFEKSSGKYDFVEKGSDYIIIKNNTSPV